MSSVGIGTVTFYLYISVKLLPSRFKTIIMLYDTIGELIKKTIIILYDTIGKLIKKTIIILYDTIGELIKKTIIILYDTIGELIKKTIIILYDTIGELIKKIGHHNLSIAPPWLLKTNAKYSTRKKDRPP